MNNYLGSDIISNMSDVLRKRGILIFLLFLIQLLFSIMIQLLFKEKLQALIRLQEKNSDVVLKEFFNILSADFVLAIIFSVIISLLFQAILTKISIQVILSKKTVNKSGVKQFFHFFIGYLLFYLIFIIAVFVFVFVGVILALIPILGILLLIFLIIGMIAGSFYYLGYYRFVPYVAMVDDVENLFRNTKLYIKGHLFLSIIVLIINSVFTEILSYYANVSAINNNTLILVIIDIIANIVSYTFILFDIVFVLTGCEKSQEMLMEDKEEDGTQVFFD